jgi:hypothetical protein
MSETGNPEPLILDTHGWVLTLCNEVDQGIGLIRQAIEKRPFLEAHYHLGEAYLRKSNPDLALEQFAAAGEFVARAEQNKTPVDRSLVEKLDAATARAREMKRQQAEAKVQ